MNMLAWKTLSQKRAGAKQRLNANTCVCQNTTIQSHARYHPPPKTIGARKDVDRLPLGPRHAGAANGTAYAVSALEGRNAHHIGVSLGRLVLVLEADVLVAVVPGCDAA
jgi:hypothetical protein